MALSDPFPMFEGRKLMNTEGYLCYLNAISNGLLSLKSFRQLIQFMNPMMRDFFYHILIGEMKHLEIQKQTLACLLGEGTGQKAETTIEIGFQLKILYTCTGHKLV